MAVDISALQAANLEFDVAPDDGGQQGSLFWIYWRRADGWITISPGWPVEVARQIEAKHMTPLRQYGEFYMANRTLQVPGTQYVLRNWQPRQDPYRLILLMGGASEFPVQQVLENGWHRQPPLRGVTFPQLTGVEYEDLKCPTCGRPFVHAPGHIDGHQNLQRHESIAHTTVASQNSQARLTAAAMQQVSGPIADVLRLMMDQQALVAQQVSQQGDALAALLAERQSGKAS